MKKTILIIFIILFFIAGIVGSLVMMSKMNLSSGREEKKEIEISDKVTDECVDEYDELQEEQIQETNSNDIEKEADDNSFQSRDGEEDYGEQYMLRDVHGKINVYKLDENGNETLLNETDIATEYLTSTDMINMENGLIVYGKESLNKLLEDFE